MTEAKFTKGGWARNIKPITNYPIIYAGRNTHVARVITNGLDLEETEANAALIVAAPRMYAALEEALRVAPCNADEDPELVAFYAEVRATLAEARGET